MSFLKPKPATQESGNKAYDKLSGTYSPMTEQGVGANNLLSGALGIPGGDSAGATAGFNSYLANSGYANVLQKLQKGIVGNMASSGLLNSGATQGRLLREGTNLNMQQFQNYLQNLSGEAGLGLQAGGLISNAGQYSKGTGGSPSTAGAIGSVVGGLASIFSDRRVKDNIDKIGELPDGLGVYEFNYRALPERRQLGVMADEVALLRPWALGEPVAGFATVNYGAL